MNKKEVKKLLFDFLDGEASFEEELFLEKKCQTDPELAEEKEALEEVLLLLRQSSKISTSSGFTKEVMAQIKRIEKRPEEKEALEMGLREKMPLREKIISWIRSPLDIHTTWVVKWFLVFSLVLFMCITVGWQKFKLRQVSLQVSKLKKAIHDIQNQPISTRFVFYHPKAKSVHLVGSFNNWQAEEKSELSYVSEEGLWSITLPLEPGQYEYMFLVDGHTWVTDPCALDFHSDGFGHKNSIVEISREIQI